MRGILKFFKRKVELVFLILLLVLIHTIMSRKQGTSVGHFLSTEKGIQIMDIAYYVIILTSIISLLFKIMHWPGANSLLIISLQSTATILCIAAFQVPKESALGLTPRQAVWLNFCSYLSLAVLILGFLFKTMHWPGCNEMIILGIASLSIASLIKGFMVKPAGAPFLPAGSPLTRIAVSSSIFFLGLSVTILSSLFFLMKWPGTDEMIIIGLGTLPFVIIAYGYLKRKNIDLIGNHSIFNLAVLILVGSFLLLRDNRSLRIISNDLNYGNMVHVKTLNYVKRGDRMLNSFNQRQKMGLSLSEADKVKQAAMLQINAASIEVIRNIDQIKILLLEKAGEDLRSTGENFLLVSKYDDKNPLIPTSLNFYAIMSKDDYDTPMRELGIRGYDDFEQNGVGIQKLWNPYVAFQNQLLELCATYGQYRLTMPKNVSVSNEEQLMELLLKNKVNETELYALVDVYSDLAKAEISENYFYGQRTHWLIDNFDHSPMIKALAVLSDMQSDIAKARAHAFQLIYQRKN